MHRARVCLLVAMHYENVYKTQLGCVETKSTTCDTCSSCGNRASNHHRAQSLKPSRHRKTPVPSSHEIPFSTIVTSSYQHDSKKKRNETKRKAMYKIYQSIPRQRKKKTAQSKSNVVCVRNARMNYYKHLSKKEKKEKGQVRLAPKNVTWYR